MDDTEGICLKKHEKNTMSASHFAGHCKTHEVLMLRCIFNFALAADACSNLRIEVPGFAGIKRVSQGHSAIHNDQNFILAFGMNLI